MLVAPAPPSGLSPEDAAARLAAEGPNELPRDRPSTLVELVWEAVREPMMALLVAAVVLYGALGELVEALTLGGWILALTALTVVQRRRTDAAVAALRDLTSPRARVVRGGVAHRIPGREVVREDIVMLAEGDRVPADGVLIEVAQVRVDESLLTGESVPVDKSLGDEPRVFAGTLIVRGHGTARVSATGSRSEIGKIGASLGELVPGRTRLEREIDRAVRRLAVVGLVASAVVAVGYGATRGAWLDGLLAGIATAMALLPEELPVVLTVFLALGAARLSQKKVLARRVQAVEALGGVTVLCTDKTGTLTWNRMRLVRLSAPGGEPVIASASLPEEVHAVVEYGILASQSDPFDPMEQAFHTLGREALAGTEHLHDGWALEQEYPLTPELLAMAHAWRSPDGAERLIAAKGAPEAIADLCHLGAAEVEALDRQVAAMAVDGLRTLAVARAILPAADALPGRSHDLAFELVGLVGLEDPLRDDVPAAIVAARRAGIRLLMITGDHPDTAAAIARQAGLATGGAMIGTELEALDDVALVARLRGTAEAGGPEVLARAVPAHKLRIVTALQAAGEVVAMTGDGVNDAPALKAADIGVAMGGRGSDVAREAAALVLTDDAFPSLIDGVHIGRRIRDNLEKAMAFVLAVHVPILGLAVAPVLAGWDLLLSPVHVVFLEMLIDPACSLAFEAEPAEPDVGERPPRRRDAPLFSRSMITLALVQGLCVLAAALVARWFAVDAGPGVGRAAALTALIAGNVGLIAVGRTWRGGRVVGAMVANRWAAGVSALALAAWALVLALPALRSLFLVELPGAGHLALSAGLGFGCLLWVPLWKRAHPR